MKRKRNRNRGFNLLETLLASALLAGAVVTIGTLSGRSLSSLRIDQETEKAWELADMQMKLIDASGVRNFQRMDRRSGTFEQDEKYTWEIEIEELDIQHLFSADLKVRWNSGPKVRQIRCQTRFYDPPDPSELEEPAAEEE